MPWVNTHRIVCSDSYFALATETKLLHLNGLKFIGVVKTATRKYLLAHLASQELEKGGTGMGWLRGIPAHMGVTYWHMYGWIKIADILSHQYLPWMLGLTWKGSAPLSLKTLVQMQTPWMLPLHSRNKRHQRSTMVPALRSTNTIDANRNPWKFRISYKHMNGIKGQT